MNDQTSAKPTFRLRDCLYIGVPLLPIVALGVLIGVACIDWHVNESKVQAIKKGYPNVTSVHPVVTPIDREVWQLSSSAHFLDSEISADTIHHRFAPWADFPPAEYFEQVAQQSKPIFDQVLAKLDSIESQVSWSFQSVLKSECIDAIHKGEQERALRAIRVVNSMRMANSMRSIVNPTLARDFWTAEQLKELEAMFVTEGDAKGLVARAVHAQKQQAIWQSEAQADKTSQVERKMSNAPSKLLAILESDTNRNVSNWEELSEVIYQNPSSRRQTKSWDQIVEFPFSQLQQSKITYRIGWLLQEVARQEETRVAIAIKRFKIRFDRFPNDLDELSKVSQAPLGFTFRLNNGTENTLHYEPPKKAGERAMLWWTTGEEIQIQ